MAIIFGPITLSTDTAGLSGFAFRMNCTTTGPSQGQMRATFAASATTGMVVANASIGETATAPNMAGTFGSANFQELLFSAAGGGSGGHGFTISAGTTIISDWVNITSSSTHFLVHIDFTSTNIQNLAGGGGNVDGWFTASASLYNAQSPALSVNAGFDYGVVSIETQPIGGTVTLMGAICL